MTKFVFITGGVVSGLGKGIASASIGTLLQESGKKISMLKIDPYINIDPGTMRPAEHGEVYVTADGIESDLDLGHYERFLSVETSSLSNTTTGQIYKTVIEKERKGDYQGQTVQIIPHITNEIQNRIIKLGRETSADIVVCEVGGTIGDMESEPFLEAIRQMSAKCGKDNVCYVHLTLIPYIETSGEIKTKPTQHSVKQLKSLGINPDILICRTKKPLLEEHIEKISLFCNVEKENIIQGRDVDNIYHVPYEFFRQNIHKSILKKFNLEIDKDLTKTKWQDYDRTNKLGTVKIAIVGKYVECDDAYKSIDESLKHAAVFLNLNLEVEKLNSGIFEDRNNLNILDKFQGILVPGGFGPRGFEGKVLTADYARRKNIPYFGICYGMQAAAIAGARYICGKTNANSTESNYTNEPVIDIMENQKNVLFGGSMRLGSYDCKIKGGKASKIYNINDDIIKERHRHRYEFNNAYKTILEEKGFVFSGVNPETDLVEILEYPDNDFYIGVQFHPEFRSRPFEPHPLFTSFISSAWRLFDEQ